MNMSWCLIVLYSSIWVSFKAQRSLNISLNSEDFFLIRQRFVIVEGIEEYVKENISEMMTQGVMDCLVYRLLAVIVVGKVMYRGKNVMFKTTQSWYLYSIQKALSSWTTLWKKRGCLAVHGWHLNFQTHCSWTTAKMI